MSETHEAERARLKHKGWIQTLSGKQFWPLDPRAEDVCIEDIAHSLSLKCRFTGHVRKFYSVADHCIRVSYAVRPAFALPALLHDAAEAYLCDVAAPIKRYIGSLEGPDETPGLVVVPFSKLEDRVLDAIFKGLGLSALRSVAESEEVKRADLAVLASEVRDLMGPPPEDWGLTVPPHSDYKIVPQSMDDVEFNFVQRFRELTRAP